MGKRRLKALQRTYIKNGEHFTGVERVEKLEAIGFLLGEGVAGQPKIDFWSG